MLLKHQIKTPREEAAQNRIGEEECSETFRETSLLLCRGGLPVLRAAATTEDGFSIEAVFTDDDQEPDVIRDFDWKWRFEWTRDQVPYLLDFEEDRVFFTAVDSDDTRYQKSAQLRIKATALTWSDAPVVDDETECTSAIRFCLHHLLPDAPDARECGAVQEVLACFRPDAAN